MLRLRREQGRGKGTGTVLDRLRVAADWAVDTDVQYGELLDDGREPLVVVHAGHRTGSGRVGRETLEAYRRLRLSVGALILPVLLEAPRLDDLYPFQRA